MRILSLLAFLVFFSYSVDLSGQVLDKGNFVIGTTLGFSAADTKVSYSISGVKEKGNGPSALQLNFAPNVGYFLIDYLAVGIGLDYTFSQVTDPNEDRRNDSDLLFGPFARYYLPVGEDMAFFLETSFGFGNASDDQYIGENKQSINTNVFALGVGPGFTIFSTDDIGVEALFKYNFASSQFDTENTGVKTSTNTRTSQFDISVGIQFYFGGVRRIGE